MAQREPQSEDTRQRITAAALSAFADHGFDAASTREIARRAGVNQGLITYYFKSKEALWREAASGMFVDAQQMLATVAADNADADPRTARRAMIKALVHFLAEQPHLARFMIEEGKRPSERMRWLVDSHLRPIYAAVEGGSGSQARKVHEFYALTGAAALIFAVRDECQRLTGVDPHSEAAVAAHAEYLAELFVP